MNEAQKLKLKQKRDEWRTMNQWIREIFKNNSNKNLHRILIHHLNFYVEEFRSPQTCTHLFNKIDSYWHNSPFQYHFLSARSCQKLKHKMMNANEKMHSLSKSKNISDLYSNLQNYISHNKFHEISKQFQIIVHTTWCELILELYIFWVALCLWVFVWRRIW